MRGFHKTACNISGPSGVSISKGPGVTLKPDVNNEGKNEEIQTKVYARRPY